MPNQRASNKKQFGVTLSKDELSKIDEVAKKMGITRTEFIRRATLAFINQEKKKSIT